MKMRLWLPTNSTVPAYVYVSEAGSTEYYFAYNPRGIYTAMDPNQWHGPFDLEERPKVAFTECVERRLCRGVTLTHLHKLGFIIDYFPGDTK